MPEFEGNVMHVPGVGAVKTVAPPEELIASYNPPPLIKGGTVLAGVGVLRVGEPIKRTANGKTWEKAAIGDAQALNLTAVDCTTEAHLINVVYGGVVNAKVVAITPANAAALATKLGGTYIAGFDYLKF